MKKLNLTFKNVNEVLTREQLKRIVGGNGSVITPDAEGCQRNYDYCMDMYAPDPESPPEIFIEQSLIQHETCTDWLVECCVAAANAGNPC